MKAVEALSSTTSASPTNDRREVFGWQMYAWAYHGFSTTVASALLGPYLTGLAQVAVGENGTILQLGGATLITAKSFFPYCVSLSVFLQVFFLPILGAIADYTNLKKRLLALFTAISIVATCALFLITGDLYLLGGLLFVIANLSFGAALVFYNAYLNDICTEDRRDSVSSRGFALGYLGGGILLAMNLVLVLGAAKIGISSTLAVRLSMLSAGIWWLVFAIFGLRRLKTRAAVRRLPVGTNYLSVGFSQLGQTFRELRHLPNVRRYILAYVLYNDGIQTVINLAPIFLAQELFVAKGREVSQPFLIGLILMVQFVAFAGALIFERLAAWLSAKRAILLSLVLWSGIIIYAYAFLQTTIQAWGMAAGIALVLGGSQALSRSLFSCMIPKGREAAYYGIYEIAEGGTAWIGTLIFGLVVAITNSYRDAILFLIILFIAGMVVLMTTDTTRAVSDARQKQGDEPPGTIPVIA